MGSNQLSGLILDGLLALAGVKDFVDFIPTPMENNEADPSSSLSRNEEDIIDAVVKVVKTGMIEGKKGNIQLQQQLNAANVAIDSQTTKLERLNGDFQTYKAESQRQMMNMEEKLGAACSNHDEMDKNVNKLTGNGKLDTKTQQVDAARSGKAAVVRKLFSSDEPGDDNQPKYGGSQTQGKSVKKRLTGYETFFLGPTLKAKKHHQVTFYHNDLYRCSCGEAYTHERSLYLHTQRYGGSAKYRCKVDDCSEVFYFEDQRNSHMAKVHHCKTELGNVRCKLCGKVFQAKERFYQHYKRRHTIISSSTTK